MDHKKSPVRRKRQSKAIEENFWDCSVCTYRNTAEAFKCGMCDVRKGKQTNKSNQWKFIRIVFGEKKFPFIKTYMEHLNYL